MCNDNNNSVCEFSVKQLFENNIIIPEIQREYVWGNPEIGSKVLENFFEDILDTFSQYAVFEKDLLAKYNEAIEKFRNFDIPDANIWDGAEKEVNCREIKSNIGFLYTYDPDPNENPKVKQVMLIDGQQRMTTIFLLLLFTAYKAGKKDEFYTMIRYKNSSSFAFDFKVRQKTRDFLTLLIEKIFSDSDVVFRFSSILNAKWYLLEYKEDLSVSAMVNALILWEKRWEQTQYNPRMFYYFLLNHIYFWRFCVLDTIQGEKLYITMNGRGRNLTAAEIIKAEVFRQAGELRATDVGKTFEDIYDFFWRHRLDGTFTADDGVQKFFRWVYLLERYEKYIALAGREVSDEDVDDADYSPIKNFREALQDFELKTEFFSNNGITYDHIERIFYALRQLMDIYERNEERIHTKKLSDYFTLEQDSFQQQAFLLLPLIRWVFNHRWDDNKKIYVIDDPTELIRFCRYLHNICSLRNVQQSINKVTSAAIRLADALTNGGHAVELNQYLADGAVVSKTICPDEEIAKAKVYMNNISAKLIEKWEELVWKLEDFKFSKIETKEDSYAVDKILTERIPEWKEDVFLITEQHIEQLETCLTSLNSFGEQLKESPDIVYQWLLFYDHLGYTVERSMIIPKSFCQLLETRDVLKAVNELESKIKIAQISDYRIAFGHEERAFIKKHWPNRLEEKDKLIQLAIYVSMCRLAGEAALDNDYNKFGFWDTPPHDLNNNIRTWCSEESEFVFRSLTKKNGRMRHDCANDLLSCHTADDNIIDAMNNHYLTEQN